MEPCVDLWLEGARFLPHMGPARYHSIARIYRLPFAFVGLYSKKHAVLGIKPYVSDCQRWRHEQDLR